MHELSLALGIIEGIQECAQREGFERVRSVHLRLGVLSGIAPSALQFSWELASAGTLAAESTLQIEHVPVTVFCEYCEAERTPRAGVGFRCPDCGNAASTIVCGREMQLVAIEVFE